ncbi:MAG: trigger factor, partial [Actinomycetota bacterium]
PEEIEGALDDAVRAIGQQIKVKGFRPGKVPRKVLEIQLGGPSALRAEALREALPEFYAKAVIEADLDPIDSPEIDITAGQEEGAVTFDAIVEVRPEISLPGYAMLEVEIPSLTVSDEDVNNQIDRMRGADGVLIDISRPATVKDYATIDIEGLDAEGTVVAKADDLVYEVGTQSVPGLDEAIEGAKADDEISFSSSLDGQGDVNFSAKVKLVQERQLPDLNDAWVKENSEFETVDALHGDVTDRLRKVKVIQAQMALRDATSAALAELVDDELVPAVLVDRETQERLHDLGHRLEHQGLSIEQFLQATGQNPESLVASLRDDAGRAAKVDLALRAIAKAESLSPSDEELAEELVRTAERLETDVETLEANLAQSGRSGAFKAELAKTRALEWLLENVSLRD